MRVSHVITRLIIGGAQENTVSTVLGLNEFQDCRVHLITGPTSGPEGSLESRFQNHPNLIQILPELVRPVRPFQDAKCLILLTRHFKSQAPDIVHTHSGKAGVLGRIAAHNAGVPVVIHTIHGPSFGRFQGPTANLAFQCAEKIAGKFTDHFVVVANAMMEQYLAAGIGHQDLYSRVFSGFDLKPFLETKPNIALREKLGLKAHHVVVGKIARLVNLKGHDDLIDAAPTIIQGNPDIRFLLIGDGLWRSRLEKKIQELGLSQYFVFTGLLRPEEVSVFVGIMDFLVHLSTREGLPRALPQALAAGKPVIAYDCDGAGEVCMDQQTGFLVPPGDLVRLRESVIHLGTNRALRQSMGSRGREFVIKHFKVEEMVLALHSLYGSLLSGKQNLGVKKP